MEVLEVLKADLRPRPSWGDLSSGQQTDVEIAKGLVFKRKVIILDEPTASLAEESRKLLWSSSGPAGEWESASSTSRTASTRSSRSADRVTVIRDGRR